MNYNYKKPKLYKEIEEKIINPEFEGKEEYN